MSRDHVVNAFLQRYAADLAQGGARALADYLLLWPGHEALVEAEFERLVPGQAPEDERLRLGPYLLERRLGRGGQGEVWLAEDERLRRPVALKILSGLSRVEDRAIQALEREALIGSRLDHPAICPVYEAGRIEGQGFMAMRYVQGDALSDWIQRARDGEGGGPLALPPQRPREYARICAFFEAVADAVAHAHERGVLHRDLKPANLLVTASGDPIVLDFGLSKWIDAEGSLSSITSAMSGTPAYIAPERLARIDGAADERADVYSLGVSLFETLTLTRPFEAPTREGLYRAILEGTPQALVRRLPGASSDLCIVVATAMARDPDQRYQDARAFAEDLARLRTGAAIRARRPSLGRRAIHFVRRHPWPTGFLVASCAALALMTVVLFGRESFERGESALRAEALARELELGWLEVGEGQRSAALEHFRAARAIDPGSSVALAGLAMAYLEDDAPERALAVLELSEALQHPELAPLRAAARFALDGTLDAAVRSEPTTSEELFLDGVLHLLQGHRGHHAAFARAAESFWLSILHPDPDPSFAWFALADALSHAPQRPWNRRLADLLRERWPDRGRVHQLAGMLLASEDALGAEQAFQRADELLEDTRIALRMAALLAPRPGRQAEADQWAARARKLARTAHERARALEFQARLAERSGRREAALELYLQAHETSDRPTPSTWEAARLLTAQQGRPAALEHWQRALERRPADPVALAGLGWQAYAEGAYGRARAFAARALSRAPFSVDALHLSLALALVGGDRAAAEGHLQSMEACADRETDSRQQISIRARVQLGRFAEARERLAASRDRRALGELAVVRALEGGSLTELPAVLALEVRARRAELEGQGAAEAWAKLAAEEGPARLRTLASTARFEALVAARSTDAPLAADLQSLLADLEGAVRDWPLEPARAAALAIEIERIEVDPRWARLLERAAELEPGSSAHWRERFDRARSELALRFAARFEALLPPLSR